MSHFALLTIFPAVMAYAAASDLFTMTIPNRLTLALVVAFAAFAAMAGLSWTELLMHVAAGALVLAISFGMFAFGWIGGGDAKLAAATALWLGFGAPLIDYFIISTIVGGQLTLLILYLRGQLVPAFASNWSWVLRLHDRNAGVPYGIALAGAALVVYPQSPIWTALLR